MDDSDLHLHALNYRLAVHPQEVQVAWDALETWFDKQLANERERCALIADDIEASNYAGYRPSGTLAARDCAERIRRMTAL